MGIYWVSQAGARYAGPLENLSEQAWAGIVAGAMFVASAVAWYFSEDEPALPEGAAWGELEPCQPQ